MKDGMLFIWVEKEYISAIIKHLETMNLFYVENVCYVMIDREMEKGKLEREGGEFNEKQEII